MTTVLTVMSYDKGALFYNVLRITSGMLSTTTRAFLLSYLLTLIKLSLVLVIYKVCSATVNVRYE